MDVVRSRHAGHLQPDDYDFRKPNARLFRARQNPVSPTPGQIDVYDWPGRYTEHQQGSSTPACAGSPQAEHQQIRGTATALGIAPGSTFTLYNAPHADDNREYLTLQANYHLKENRYASGDDQSSEHRIDFIVLPADVPRTPQQATAENPRAADRPGGRPGRRINLDRQIRPHQGEIPLGPLRAEGRRQLLLGARLQRPGRRATAACRSRASTTKWWWTLSTAIRIGRSSPGAFITKPACRRGRACRRHSDGLYEPFQKWYT